MKNLGAEDGQEIVKETGIDTDVSIARPASGFSMDKTLVMPRPSGIDPQAAAHADGDVTLFIPAPASASAPEAAPEQSKNKTFGKLAAVAAVAALAICGLAFKWFSGPGSTPPAVQVSNPELAASAPVAAASSAASSLALASTLPAASASAQLLGANAPASAPVVVGEPAAAASRPSAAAPPKPQAAAQAALRSASAASKPLAVVKKVTPEKERTSRESAVKATESAASATTPVTPAPAANSPRAACEDRVLLGFQTCLTEQCTKPAFANHPTCVERRAMDERRREAERNR